MFKKQILLFLAAFIIGLLVLVFWVKYSANNTVQNIQYSSSSSPQDLDLEHAPSQSLRGKIVNISGDLYWQSRTQTESAKITQTRDIQQGETLETKDNTEVEVNFQKVVTVKLQSNAKIYFAQTLPQNIVLGQSSGVIEYKKEGTNTISINSLGLLINLNEGDIKITTKTDKNLISVNIIKGSITIAYKNASDETVQETINSPSNFIFDNQRKTLSYL